MRSYETARNIFSFLEFVAWAGVVLGALVALGGAGAATSFSRSGAGLIAALPGILIMISGIFLVGVVQSGRANVDSAEYGQQMLQLARDQMEISRQSLKLQGGSPVTSFASENRQKQDGVLPGIEASNAATTYANDATQSPDAPVVEPVSEIIEHKGQSVEHRERKYIWNDIPFDSLEDLDRHLVNMARFNPELLSKPKSS